MKEIKMIPVKKIGRNPDNPRKDLGDLSELVSSIKANGVLQNLTVVPHIGEITGTWDGESYMVVIGHRRLAAAKLAGLEEVPCEVRELTHGEQVQTMLVENMARKDLTVYEEAQGFQMMLDLGLSVEQVAEKAGLSETTVRNRRKLLDLDPEIFKETAERNVSLSEYMKLDKLEDPARKNEVLKTIGTNNFDMTLRNAIAKEKDEKKRAEKVAVVQAFATEVPNDTRNQYATVKTIYPYVKLEDIKRPEGDGPFFYCVDQWNYIFILEKRPEGQDEIDEAARRELQEAEAREDTRKQELVNLKKEAYLLRAEFIDKVSATTIRKHLADVVGTWAYLEIIPGGTGYMDDDDIYALFDVDPVDEDEADEDTRPEDIFSHAMMLTAAEKAPEKKLLKMLWLHSNDSEAKGYSNWRGEYSESDDLDALYALLTKLGYEMSDVEKALQDGTHALFQKEEQE